MLDLENYNPVKVLWSLADGRRLFKMESSLVLCFIA
uniref:Uncharacterized protein n=1 Tax=Anguilla anguilla TaxID=7936 RepID=A0A0E9VID6_ANGAN